jgi:hypothetical protein
VTLLVIVWGLGAVGMTLYGKIANRNAAVALA